MARPEPKSDPDTASPTPRARPEDPTTTPDPAARFRRAGEDGAATAEEREIWTGRTSWKHFAPRLVLWLVGNISAATALIWIAGKTESFESKYLFWIIVVFVVVSGLAIPGRVVLRVLSERYRLTSQRLFVTRGILSQTIDQTELVRIDDVRIHKTIVDRLFGLGTVSIVSTDASHGDETLEGIADADGTAEAIRSHVRTMRGKSLYIESL